VGVVKRGTVNSGVTGAWSTLNRGATGDARASSANSQVADFLGDYVSRLCRGIVRHIYVRRSKVRKHGSHGRLQKRQLCLQELVSGATASVLPGPDFALGDHPAPRAFPRLKAVAYPSGLSRGRACDSRLPGSDCPSHEPSARLWRLWVVAPLVMNARRVTQLGDGRYRNVLSGGDSFVSMAPAMVCP
jgi:hypothetical protein